MTSYAEESSRRGWLLRSELWYLMGRGPAWKSTTGGPASCFSRLGTGQTMVWCCLRSKMVRSEAHECSRLWKSYAPVRHCQLSKRFRLQPSVRDVTLSEQYFQEWLTRGGPAGQSCGSAGPSHEVAMVSTFGGHFVVYFGTRSSEGFSFFFFRVVRKLHAPGLLSRSA
jgi:hypothetical protein